MAKQPSKVAEMATKLLLAIIHKHWLGGCTINMPHQTVIS